MTGKDPAEADVVALLLKEMATKERDVAGFQARFLNGRLLSKGKVENWIKKKAKGDGPATAWLDIPLPSKFKFQINRKTGAIFTKPRFTVSKKHPALGVHYRLLAYGVPQDRWERVVHTRAGGVLEQLRQISVRLATRYGWDEGQATLFVLTGLIPLHYPIRVTVDRDKINLRVDPTITPRQFVDSYRRIRRQLLTRRTRT